MAEVLTDAVTDDCTGQEVLQFEINALVEE